MTDHITTASAWRELAGALMAADRTARRNGHNSAAHVAAMERYEVAWTAYQRAASAQAARAIRDAGF